MIATATAADVRWIEGADFALVCRHRETGRLISAHAQWSGNRETPAAMRRADKLRKLPRHPDHEIVFVKRLA